MSAKSILLAGVGFVFLILGAIGLVLPVWPTTPFVLVAAGCFASTPKLHAWMMRLPFFSEYIRSYQEGKGISRKTVAISLIFLWSMLVISAFHIRTVWIVCCLAVVGIAVTIHIVWLAKGRKRSI